MSKYSSMRSVSLLPLRCCVLVLLVFSFGTVSAQLPPSAAVVEVLNESYCVGSSTFSRLAPPSRDDGFVYQIRLSLQNHTAYRVAPPTPHCQVVAPLRILFTASSETVDDGVGLRCSRRLPIYSIREVRNVTITVRDLLGYHEAHEAAAGLARPIFVQIAAEHGLYDSLIVVTNSTLTVPAVLWAAAVQEIGSSWLYFAFAQTFVRSNLTLMQASLRRYGSLLAATRCTSQSPAPVWSEITVQLDSSNVVEGTDRLIHFYNFGPAGFLPLSSATHLQLTVRRSVVLLSNVTVFQPMNKQNDGCLMAFQTDWIQNIFLSVTERSLIRCALWWMAHDPDQSNRTTHFSLVHIAPHLIPTGNPVPPVDSRFVVVARNSSFLLMVPPLAHYQPPFPYRHQVGVSDFSSADVWLFRVSQLGDASVGNVTVRIEDCNASMWGNGEGAWVRLSDNVRNTSVRIARVTLQLYLVAEGWTETGNGLGSLVRTSDCYQVDAVVEDARVLVRTPAGGQPGLLLLSDLTRDGALFAGRRAADGGELWFDVRPNLDALALGRRNNLMRNIATIVEIDMPLGVSNVIVRRSSLAADNRFGSYTVQLGPRELLAVAFSVHAINTVLGERSIGVSWTMTVSESSLLVNAHINSTKSTSLFGGAVSVFCALAVLGYLGVSMPSSGVATVVNSTVNILELRRIPELIFFPYYFALSLAIMGMPATLNTTWENIHMTAWRSQIRICEEGLDRYLVTPEPSNSIGISYMTVPNIMGKNSSFRIVDCLSSQDFLPLSVSMPQSSFYYPNVRTTPWVLTPQRIAAFTATNVAVDGNASLSITDSELLFVFGTGALHWIDGTLQLGPRVLIGSPMIVRALSGAPILSIVATPALNVVMPFSERAISIQCASALYCRALSTVTSGISVMKGLFVIEEVDIAWRPKGEGHSSSVLQLQELFPNNSVWLSTDVQVVASCNSRLLTNDSALPACLDRGGDGSGHSVEPTDRCAPLTAENALRTDRIVSLRAVLDRAHLVGTLCEVPTTSASLTPPIPEVHGVKVRQLPTMVTVVGSSATLLAAVTPMLPLTNTFGLQRSLGAMRLAQRCADPEETDTVAASSGASSFGWLENPWPLTISGSRGGDDDGEGDGEAPELVARRGTILGNALVLALWWVAATAVGTVLYWVGTRNEANSAISDDDDDDDEAPEGRPSRSHKRGRRRATRRHRSTSLCPSLLSLRAAFSGEKRSPLSEALLPTSSLWLLALLLPPTIQASVELLQHVARFESALPGLDVVLIAVCGPCMLLQAAWMVMSTRRWASTACFDGAGAWMRQRSSWEDTLVYGKWMERAHTRRARRWWGPRRWLAALVWDRAEWAPTTERELAALHEQRESRRGPRWAAMVHRATVQVERERRFLDMFGGVYDGCMPKLAHWQFAVETTASVLQAVVVGAAPVDDDAPPLSDAYCTASFSVLLAIAVGTVGFSLCWAFTSRAANGTSLCTNCLTLLMMILALAEQWTAMTVVSVVQTFVTVALLVPLLVMELWCGTGGTLRLLRRLIGQRAVFAALWARLRGGAADTERDSRESSSDSLSNSDEDAEEEEELVERRTERVVAAALPSLPALPNRRSPSSDARVGRTRTTAALPRSQGRLVVPPTTVSHDTSHREQPAELDRGRGRQTVPSAGGAETRTHPMSTNEARAQRKKALQLARLERLIRLITDNAQKSHADRNGFGVR